MIKKSFLAGMLFLFISATGFAAPVVPDYQAEKVTEHAHVIYGPTQRPNPENLGFMNNPVIVIGSDSVIIFDPGASLESGRMVLRQVKKLTDKPVSHVFISHVHGDHWLGNQAIREQYPDVKLYAHPEMIREARESEAKAWIERMSTLTNGATDGTVAIIPENAVADGDEFKISGLTVRVHIMPDVHSGTDAMYELVEDSLVMTGDNVTNQRMPRFDHGTFRGTIKMADMLLGKDFKYFIPGHGPGGDREVIEGFRKYTATVYETAAKLYEEGLSDFEMKDRIVEKLKNYHNWSMFDDQIGRHISLAVLEAEKAAFE